MSRVVSTETPGKRRDSIFKLIVKLMPAIQSQGINQETRNDILAFIILSLDEVEKSIDDTLGPWEKRGYWSKADQFRLEWEWVGEVKREILAEEISKGWGRWPDALADLFVHLASVKPARKKLGEFWKGSYSLYKNQK